MLFAHVKANHFFRAFRGPFVLLHEENVHVAFLLGQSDGLDAGDHFLDLPTYLNLLKLVDGVIVD